VTTEHYSAMAKSLHWLVAALVLAVFALGISFSRFNEGDALYFSFAYGTHMSIGMVLLVVSVWCVSWRLTHPYPRLTQDMNAVWRLSAKTAHFLLYLYIVVVPIVGWAVLSLRRRPPVFVGSLHWPNIWFLADMPKPQRSYYHDILLPAHITVAYIGICIVGVHVAAALYHHFWRRDDVLTSMLPKISMHRVAAGGSGLDRANPGLR